MLHTRLLVVLAAALQLAVIAADPSWKKLTVTSSYVGRGESALSRCGDDKICLLGGRGSNNKPSAILDTSKLSWTNGKSPPVEIHHFQAFRGPDKCVWVVGAWTGGYPAEKTVNSTLKYCADKDEWSFGPKIDRPRGAGGAFFYNEAIYLISGNVGGHNTDAKLVPWFDALDPKTGTWSKLPDIPNPRDHFHAAVLGNKLYVAGGRDSTDESIFNDVESKVDVFDFATQKWSSIDDFARPRGGTFSAVFDSKVFVMGGEGQGRAWSEVDILQGNTFTIGPDMPTRRHGAGAATCNGAIWVAGGVPQQGGGSPALDTVAYFDGDTAPVCSDSTPSTNAPTTSTLSTTTSTAATTTTGMLTTTIPTTTGNTGTTTVSGTSTTGTATTVSTLPGTLTTTSRATPPGTPATTSRATSPPARPTTIMSTDPSMTASVCPSPDPQSSPNPSTNTPRPTTEPQPTKTPTPTTTAAVSSSSPGPSPSGDGTSNIDETNPSESTPEEPDASVESAESESACFPSDAIVELRDGTVTTMAELRIGDHVKVAHPDSYSPIYFFSHNHPHVVSDVIKIDTTVEGISLSVSPGHLIYVNGNLVPASNVEVGDEISVSHVSSTKAIVTAKKLVASKGLHNPHTVHGDIVVNGVIASTFTSSVDPSLAKILLSPFRIIYHMIGPHRAVDSLNHAVLRALDYTFWKEA